MKKIITLITVCYCVSINAQTPITDTNFKAAVNICLGIDPINGNCTSRENGAFYSLSQVVDIKSNTEIAKPTIVK
jgi:hypothetical protein